MKKYVIAEGTCNGEENQFAEWMRNEHPEIDEVVVENTMNSGLFIDGEREENEPDYWGEYC